jgi:hypothetical protein
MPYNGNQFAFFHYETRWKKPSVAFVNFCESIDLNLHNQALWLISLIGPAIQCRRQY